MIFKGKPEIDSSLLTEKSPVIKRMVHAIGRWLGFAPCVQDQNGNPVPFYVDITKSTPEAYVLVGNVWKKVGS